MRRSWPRTVGLLAAVVLTLAGCGRDDDAEADTDAQEQPTGEATTPTDAVTEPTPAGTTEPAEPAETEDTVYEVQRGDTLWDIAEQHGTTVEAIVEANGIDDPSRIHPGDELVIPGG